MAGWPQQPSQSDSLSLTSQQVQDVPLPVPDYEMPGPDVPGGKRLTIQYPDTTHHTPPHHHTRYNNCLSRLSLEAVPRNLWDHKKIVRSPSIVSYGCGQNKPGQGPLRKISNTKTTKH